MKRYIQYIIDQTIETETNLIVQTRSWGDLCDWLGLEDEKILLGSATSNTEIPHC